MSGTRREPVRGRATCAAPLFPPSVLLPSSQAPPSLLQPYYLPLLQTSAAHPSPSSVAPILPLRRKHEAGLASAENARRPGIITLNVRPTSVVPRIRVPRAIEGGGSRPKASTVRGGERRRGPPSPQKTRTHTPPLPTYRASALPLQKAVTQAGVADVQPAWAAASGASAAMAASRAGEGG